MDEFVCSKLREWKLEKWIEKFKDEEVDRESFYCLEDPEINNLIGPLGPRARFRNNLKLLKTQEQQHLATNQASDQCLPSTSGANDSGKKTLDHLGESSQHHPLPAKRRCDIAPGSLTHKAILTDVKAMMGRVLTQLQDNHKTKLKTFLMNKIKNLETETKELVGVFGRTGSGKSYLINAIIENTDLLPHGSGDACTSVMIKVEASTTQKYEAHIEFITKEEWKNEMWCFDNKLYDSVDLEEMRKKVKAVYGDMSVSISHKTCLDNKYFKEIPEFLEDLKKILTVDTAEDLAKNMIKYAKNVTQKSTEGATVMRQYCPLVKCVTVKVPDGDLLQNVTLVDLPGNGDRNKSRDKMWKEIVGECSAVWVVADINRAATEKEPWEILENVTSLMGNGGQCRVIHFICSRSDQNLGGDIVSVDEGQRFILERNRQVKEQLKCIIENEKPFIDDTFSVFTVSSKEYLLPIYLETEETEIPELQDFLQNLNDGHSETLRYVSGAKGILSLIQGAQCTEVAAQKRNVSVKLEERMSLEIVKVRRAIEKANTAFQRRLVKGVRKSTGSLETTLNELLYPEGESGSSFHKTLKFVVHNNGYYKSKRKYLESFNDKLSTNLTGSIDKEFMKTFPNQDKCGPFNDVIRNFSLGTESLIKEHQDVTLQLIFLKTEEENIKTQLNRAIRDRKKTIYRSLTATIEEIMQDCYEEAKGHSGTGSMEKMRETIKYYVQKNINMFEKAKDEMLKQLTDLKDFILEALEKTLKESIELSLKTDDSSFPDTSYQLDILTKYHRQLECRPL